MNCQEALPFISPLYDGEPVPIEVPEHVQKCPPCRQRLNEYAQLDAECRLLASASQREEPLPDWLPQTGNLQRRIWSILWTSRVLVPRAALIIVMIAIVGLSLKLSLTRAQPNAQRLMFQYDLSLSTPESHGVHPIGRGFVDGPTAEMPWVISDPQWSGLALFRIQDVRTDLVRISVRAQRIQGPVRLDCTPVASGEPRPCSDEQRSGEIKRLLATAQEREYPYRPGQTLEIPMQGGGSLILTGRVTPLPQPYSWERTLIEPAPGEIVLNGPVLVPERSLISKPAGIATASGEKSCVTFYLPHWGLFIFALHPFPGSSEASVYHGQMLLKLDGKWYYLFSASPIIGDNSGGTLYYSLVRGYKPSRYSQESDSAPVASSEKDIGDLLRKLRG
jgi:hypothetical protein